MSNSNLHKAKVAKNDEFYTQLSDIEKELVYYTEYFKNKVVYCNCDDEHSNFYQYFKINFAHLGLKKLIATHYEADRASYKLVIDDTERREPLLLHGDFRSDECVEFLKEADIVATNPPFSLFREYINQLIKYDKKFIVVGSWNAVSYKDIFSLIKADKLWLGCNPKIKKFRVPDSYEGKLITVGEDGFKYAQNVGNVCWFTNLDHKKRHEDLILYEHYTPEKYPKYDNYDAINIDKGAEIPCDYDGLMGVPITFLDKYNPAQFEILDGIGRYSMLTGPTSETHGTYLTKVNGRPKYARVIIRRK